MFCKITMLSMPGGNFFPAVYVAHCVRAPAPGTGLGSTSRFHSGWEVKLLAVKLKIHRQKTQIYLISEVRFQFKSHLTEEVVSAPPCQ